MLTLPGIMFTILVVERAFLACQEDRPVLYRHWITGRGKGVKVMVFRKTLFIILVSGVLVAGVPHFAHAVSASAVTLNFMCPCGTCDEALSTCECPQSDGYRAQISGMVGRGYSEEQVIQDFKNRFGPDVLIANAAMAPRAGVQLFNRKTFGFLLLLGSVSLVAFTLGHYTKASSPAGRTKRSASTSKTVRGPAEKSRRSVEDRRNNGEERYLEDHEI